MRRHQKPTRCQQNSTIISETMPTRPPRSAAAERGDGQPAARERVRSLSPASRVSQEEPRRGLTGGPVCGWKAAAWWWSDDFYHGAPSQCHSPGSQVEDRSQVTYVYLSDESWYGWFPCQAQWERTKFVSLAYASNVLGVINSSRRLPSWFISKERFWW